MIKTTAIQPTPGRRSTPIDIAIARAVYPVLVDVAAVNPPATISFEKLIQRTREHCVDQDHPIHSQIPTSMGRRLEALRLFTQPRGYPDLSSLVVSANGENPFLDAVARRDAVRAFDWSKVNEAFLEEMNERDRAWEAGQLRPVRRSMTEAITLMATYYREHRARYHPNITQHRAEIIAELVAGADVDKVFRNIDRNLREPDDPVST